MKTYTESSVKFYLKDPAADRPTLIYLALYYDYKRFITSTGLSVLPLMWDAEEQKAITNQERVPNKIGRRDNESLNTHLHRFRSALLKVLNGLQLAQVSFDNKVIKQQLDNELGRVKKERHGKVEPELEQETFTGYIERFVSEARAGKRLNAKNAHFSPGTLINYTKYKNILIAYQSKTGGSLAFDAFTLNFYESFKKYLTAEGKTLNYVGAVLNGVKMLLKYAHRDGLHQNTDFQKKEFRKIEEEVDAIYLNDAELQTLYKLDLTKDLRLDHVRDVFLIGCYTGLRFTNYTQLRPENITHGGRLLTVQTIKNGLKVSIPLNPNVLAILNKYNGVLPRALSNQKFNDYLKDLGKMAELKEPVQRTRTLGGIRRTENAEKWEWITTHTARRSFATNAFLAGVPTVSIMKITGHKSESQFLKYIKVSSEQNAMILLEHPHFSRTG
ncbi:site-specific integrase [Nibrella saemangeumensis]|uniref:Site-specific integrase n=1 Tax=Nibrella saemangeumensis TaxID=1084526 RepID=A0ABP8M7X1_9BACT